MSPSTISVIPDEILITIFSNLRFQDRKRARLVCKKWYTLCESSCLTKNEIISVEMHEILEEFRMSRKNLYLRIITNEKPLKEIDFWKNYGSQLKTLELNFLTHLRSPILNYVFNYCENLSALYLSDKNEYSNDEESNLILKDLNHLRELYIWDMPDCNGQDFNKLTRHMPNLEQVGLTYLTRSRGNQCVLPAVIELIRRQYSILRTLKLSGCGFIDDSALESILNLLGPQLIAIDLSDCTIRSSPALLSKQVPNLEKIDLSNTNVTIQCCSTIFESLKKLKTVSIGGTSINDHVLCLILDLEDLTYLDLSYCKGLTYEGMIKAFTRRKYPKINYLYLNYIEGTWYCRFSDSISSNLPNIKVLEMIEDSEWYCSDLW